MKKNHIMLPLALVSSVFLLLGCSSKTRSVPTKAEAYDITNYAMEAAPQHALGNNASYAAAADTSTQNTSDNLTASSRKLIKTVSIDIETTAFTSTMQNISDKVKQLNGYIESSDISGISKNDLYNGERSAYLTVRIPSDKSDSFIDFTDNVGNITRKSENINDITLQYSDTESHKKSLEIEQKRLWELLEKADSVETIIALETRLSEILYQLDSYESQLRIYDNQVDYTTISLRIEEVKNLSPDVSEGFFSRISSGLKKNLDYLYNGLINLIIGLICALPTIITFAVILFIIIRIIRSIIKRMRAKKRS